MAEPKKETVRIDLPPSKDQSGSSPAKRETVRITLPSKPGLGTPVSGEAPKPAPSNMSQSSDSTPKPPPAAPPAGIKPPPTAPKKPEAAPVAQPANPAAQTVPLNKPAPPPAAPAKPAPAAAAGSAEPSKKKTSRIQLPADGGKDSKSTLPKATVKLQQTQPLKRSGPSATPGSALTQQAPAASEGGSDGLVTALSLAALVAGLVAFASQLMTYLAGA